MREGNVAAAQAALAAAKEAAARLTEREASHVAFFDLVFAGQTDAAIAVLHRHLAAWPRDARARVRACLLRERRTGHGARLSVLLAIQLSARWIFLAIELASFALRTPGRQLGSGVAPLPGRHRARPPQRWTSAEGVGWHGVFVAFGTRGPSARYRHLARDLQLRE
jgi:hypothetical protein